MQLSDSASPYAANLRSAAIQEAEMGSKVKAVSLNETGILNGLTSTAFSINELVSRVGSKVIWGRDGEETIPSEKQFVNVMQVAKQLIILDT